MEMRSCAGGSVCDKSGADTVFSIITQILHWKSDTLYMPSSGLQLQFSYRNVPYLIEQNIVWRTDARYFKQMKDQMMPKFSHWTKQSYHILNLFLYFISLSLLCFNNLLDAINHWLLQPNVLETKNLFSFGEIQLCAVCKLLFTGARFSNRQILR